MNKIKIKSISFTSNPTKLKKIHKNKGYGTKLHLDGIKEYGISKWHRKTYGICKDYC